MRSSKALSLTFEILVVMYVLLALRLIASAATTSKSMCIEVDNIHDSVNSHFDTPPTQLLLENRPWERGMGYTKELWESTKKFPARVL